MTAERYEWTYKGKTEMRTVKEICELNSGYKEKLIREQLKNGARCLMDLARSEGRKPVKPSAASKKYVDGLVRVHKASRQR